jgi:hypothetical protein
MQSRGPRSNFLASDPIVIVDGIRVDALEDATVLDLGVSTPRLDDILPEDIAHRRDARRRGGEPLRAGGSEWRARHHHQAGRCRRPASEHTRSISAR